MYEGKRSEPADVVRSLQAVAMVKQIPEAEVAKVTTANAVLFFGLGHQGDPRGSVHGSKEQAL
jgi:Tat protein secretion system quality control protein TatD with DNase activity